MIKQLHIKRVLSFILALVLMAGSFSVSAFAYEEETVDFFSESTSDTYPINNEQQQSEVANEANGADNEHETPDEFEKDMQTEENIDENILESTDENTDKNTVEVTNEELDESIDINLLADFSHGEIVTYQSLNVSFAQRGATSFPASWIQSGWSPWGTGIFTLTMGSNTTLAYCVEPRLPAPVNGAYVASVLAQNSSLSRALYYMWGAPGQNELFTPERRAMLPNTGATNIPNIGNVPNTEYVLSHLIVSYLYSGRNPDHPVMQPASPGAIAVVRQWVAWLDALPNPPHANKSFSNANLTATLDLTAGHQYTPWTTFQADHRNTITVPAPTGAQVQSRSADGSWTGAWGNSATVSGGQQFRFRSNTLTSVTPGRWTSPPIHGSNNMQWRALLMDRPSGEQSIGGWGAVDDPVSPITFSINWQEAIGSLRIIKTVEHWNTRAGFTFEVRRVSDNHLVGRFTSPVSGEIYIPNLVAGNYSILEIVPSGFVVPTPNPRTVAVVAGRTGTAASSTTFNNIRQRGVITVQKENTDPVMGDWCLSGASFHVRDASGAHVATIVTDENGYGRSINLPLGTYTVSEYQAPWGYVINPTIFTRTITGDNSNRPILYATPIVVPQDPQVGRIIVTKLDSETDQRPQGDATLNGATFHIYDTAGTRVDVLETGNTNTVTSRELPLGTYYVEEQNPPHGYTLNATRHSVVIDYAGQSVEVSDVNVNVYNEVFRGRVSLIKFTDAKLGNTQIRPPLEGAIFEIFLRSAGSFEDALPTERDRITTDQNGFAQTVWLPYGWYVVDEVYAPGDVRLVDRFYVYIDSDGQTHYFILENPEFQSRVRIVKQDATTGERIPTAGVAFRVKDLATDEWVSQTFNYPTPTTIDIFHTNEEGWLVMPESLRSGEYELHEICAPYGYLLSEEPVPFTIHSAYDNEENMVEVRMSNEPVMGIISVEKECEETGRRLSGAVFEVIAAEDIITPDGTIRIHEGEVADTITTDENGMVESIPLFLGNYYLVEIEAPHGFLHDPAPIPVTLSYENQYVEVVTEFVTVENTPIKGVITIDKVCEETGERLKGAVFHIYDAGGELVDTITTDEDGMAISNELSLGNYTVVEMYAPDGFIIDGASHDVALSWESQYIAIVHEFITVENQPIKGSIRIIKVCAETSERLEGAVFGLYLNNERTAEGTTNEDGYAYFLDVPFGEYEIRELQAPDGFVLSDEKFSVNITEHEEIIEITIKNEREPDKPKVPQTGDSTDLPWVRLILTGLAIVGIVIGLVMLNVKKKKEY